MIFQFLTVILFLTYDSLLKLFCNPKKQSLCVARSRFCSTLKGTKTKIRKSSLSWVASRFAASRSQREAFVPETLWEEVSGGRAKGRSLEADRINRHLNIRTQIGKHYQDICDRGHTLRLKRSRMSFPGFRREIPAASRSVREIHRRPQETCRHRPLPRYMEPLL